MGTVLGDGLVDDLVAASEAVVAPLARSAVVELAAGKSERAVVEIADGRVVGPVEAAGAQGDGEIDLSVPLTADQLTAFVGGTDSMSQAYMRGDLKPVGSTGALLAVLALFDDPAFRAVLADR